jgi:hypothetical protein
VHYPARVHSRPRAPHSVFLDCLQRDVVAGRRRWNTRVRPAKGLLIFLSTLDHLREVIEDRLHPLQVPDPCSGRHRVRTPLPEGFRGQAHGLMDQHPVSIGVVVGRDDAAVPVTMGSVVDKEVPTGQTQRRQNGVQGTLRMAIEEDFVSGGRNAETRGVVVMGRAAGLPLVSVLPGLRTAVRDRCGQGSGIGTGCKLSIH